MERDRIRNISELAKLVGVSAGTVSRALADSPLVNAKTREKIQALAKEYDFRPNVMARNLRIQRTGAISVVIPLGHDTGQHISDPFFMTILGYLADGLAERSYDLVLTRVIPADGDWLFKIIDSGRIDGVIVIGQSNQSETLDRVAARYLPMVAWGAHANGQVHCSVGSDNHQGGELATQHLIEQGCRSIAFFGDPTAIEIRHRLDGCRAAMSRAGLVDRLTVLPAHLTAEAAHPDITSYLDTVAERPQGIVAASDVIAMSALRSLAEHGLSVPGDVRLVGYDDLLISQNTVPRLTTIRQDIELGARHLIDLLFRRIAGELTGSIVMQPELIVRGSSGS